MPRIVKVEGCGPCSFGFSLQGKDIEMNDRTFGASGAIGHSLITATYATAIADAILALVESIASARQRLTVGHRRGRA